MKDIKKRLEDRIKQYETTDFSKSDAEVSIAYELGRYDGLREARMIIEEKEK
jgi:hypothetical protein